MDTTTHGSQCRGLRVYGNSKEGTWIRFVVDPLYVQDPEEAHAILEQLMEWIEKWNQVEVAKRY